VIFGSGQSVLARRQIPEVECLPVSGSCERLSIEGKGQWAVDQASARQQVLFLSSNGVEEHERAATADRCQNPPIGRKGDERHVGVLPALEPPDQIAVTDTP
jgi:hypothetical protein